MFLLYNFALGCEFCWEFNGVNLYITFVFFDCHCVWYIILTTVYLIFLHSRSILQGRI